MRHKAFALAALAILLVSTGTGVSAAALPVCCAHSLPELAPQAPGWQQVNSSGFGQPLTGEVTALAAFNGRLYAGTSNGTDGAQVFRSPDGVTWAPITQPGFGVPHDNRSPAILDLAVFRGKLYASTGRGDGPAQLWRAADGAPFAPMVITGFGDPDTVDITALTEYNEMLYAGAKNLTSGAQIWRSFSGDSNTWKQVAPAAPAAATGAVTGMAVFNGLLYAAVESEAPAQVWRSSGSAWTTVVSDGFGSPLTTSTGGLAVFGGYLYVGAGNESSGAQLWRSSSGTSWQPVIDPGFGDPNNQKVELVFVWQNRLYAGVSNTQTGIELWCSADGTHWERANQDGFGDPNNAGSNGSQAAVDFLGDLYVGTSNSLEGGELWRLHLLRTYTYLPIVPR